MWQLRRGMVAGRGALDAAAGASVPLSLDGTPVFANGSSGTSLALPAFSTSNPNDIILAPILSNGLPITSITGGGLTFARVPSFTPGANIDLWWAVAPSALSSVVFTLNWTGTDSYTTWGVLAVTGGKTSAPFDAAATAQTTGGAPYATLTTSAADTFAIGFAANSAASPGSGWTNIYAANFLAVNYQIFSSTQSSDVFDTASQNASIVAAVVQGP
jgi:hypothetical protein